MSESPQVQGEAGAGRGFETDSAGEGGIRRADFAACQLLAREIGRLLNGFVPPTEGYRPEPPPPPGPLDPEVARDLGAASLSDFFALALNGEARAEAGCLPAHFPKGPETFRQALTSVEVEINRLVQAGINLEKNWPADRSGLEAALRPLEERRAALIAGLADLRRAARLWLRFKDESDLWLDEAKVMGRKARRLEKSQALILKADFGDEPVLADSPQIDLAGAVHILQTEVASARALVLESDSWAGEAEALNAELDDLLSLAVVGSEPDLDWAAIGRQLSGRLTELIRVEQNLVSALPRAAETLEGAARVLAEAEKNLAGAHSRDTRSRLESMGRGVAALWRSVLDRRRDMARLYFFLPERLGRPAYLEKNFLAVARVLGRAQALLEDLRHRLSLAEGRLSSSQKLKAESAELLERLWYPRHRPEIMNTARHRLKSLASAAARAAAAPYEGRNNLTRLLASANLEKERLAEQVAEAQRGLSDLGLTKARLVRVFDRQTGLLQAADQERSRLAEENKRLKGQRGELTQRQDTLSESLNQARQRFQDLRVSLQKGRGDFRDILAEQRDVAARLEELRQEKYQVKSDRRSIGTLLRRHLIQEAETEATMEALAAELNRHREELAAVSLSRQALGETASALRRRLDLLSQAHRSLKTSLAKNNRRLVRAEDENDFLNLALTRQKRNLLRLVGIRQELRAELGSARLKITDLENERANLLTRLEEAKQSALAADSEKKLMEDRLGGLELEKGGLADQLAELKAGVSDSLLPFIAVLSESLWRGEARFQRTRESHVALQSEFGQLTRALEQRDHDLIQARESLKSLSESQGRRHDSAQDQENLVANHSSQKVSRTISVIKRRYDRRLDDAGQVESALRQDLDLRTQEMMETWNSLAELEPILDFFFQTAEQSLPPGDANLELARCLREENRSLLAESGGRVGADQISAALVAKLAEFRPLVVFLARFFVAGVAELAQARQERETLEKFLLERESLLADRSEEVTALKGELVKVDRDLAENDGRLETVWAAMNYLGSRAGDRLGEMRGRLENQTRQLDGLAAELNRRGTRIRELEERQDQLSLLYWALVAHAGAEKSASKNYPDPALADAASPGLGQARNSDGFGRQLLEGAKKAARRSFLTLVLAGSLSLAGFATEAEAGPLEHDLLPTIPPALAARFDSAYIGRPVGLETVATNLRLAGREAVEERLEVIVGDLAEVLGLTSGEFLRLLRAARSPENAVHLADFSGREGALALIQPHCPKLVRHMAAWPPEIADHGRLSALLKNAADFKLGEGAFWERLFFDLWAEKGDQSAALAGLLHHMTGRKGATLALEFAGRLAPCAPLENLGYDRFVDFMSAYLKSAWAGPGDRPRELAARRLAGDLYFNTRFFRLPLTLFAVLIQQEAEEGLAGDLLRRGATLALHHRAAHLARQTREAAVAWEAGRPLLCDLDEALDEEKIFIEALYRKKLALVQALNRYLSAGDNLLAFLPD